MGVGVGVDAGAGAGAVGAGVEAVVGGAEKLKLPPRNLRRHHHRRVTRGKVSGFGHASKVIHGGRHESACLKERVSVSE